MTNETFVLPLLKKEIAKVHALEDDAWEALSKKWFLFKAKRKQVLTLKGEKEKYIYFVTEGVQRAYYTSNDKEATLVFTYPYSFSGVVDSFFLQIPARCTFETLTTSTFLRIHYADFCPLIEKHRSIETWIRKAVTFTLSGVLERQLELAAFDAKQKFTTLLNRSPHILNLIPHKYLASYIGVDPVTFSKMLGTVKL